MPPLLGWCLISRHTVLFRHTDFALSGHLILTLKHCCWVTKYPALLRVYPTHFSLNVVRDGNEWRRRGIPSPPQRLRVHIDKGKTRIVESTVYPRHLVSVQKKLWMNLRMNSYPPVNVPDYVTTMTGRGSEQVKWEGYSALVLEISKTFHADFVSTWKYFCPFCLEADRALYYFCGLCIGRKKVDEFRTAQRAFDVFWLH